MVKDIVSFQQLYFRHNQDQCGYVFCSEHQLSPLSILLGCAESSWARFPLSIAFRIGATHFFDPRLDLHYTSLKRSHLISGDGGLF